MGHPVHVEPRVPDVEERHAGEAGDLRPVAAGGAARCCAPLGLSEAVIPRGDHHAGGEALDVPLERSRQCLVEVVDVEHETAIRRGEHPEVQEMRVAAGLNADVGSRRVREVPRHLGCRAAEVGERRREHPPVANLDYVGQAAASLSLERLHGIGPVGRRIPFAMAGPGNVLASGASQPAPLLRRQHLVRRRDDAWSDPGHDPSDANSVAAVGLRLTWRPRDAPLGSANFHRASLAPAQPGYRLDAHVISTEGGMA
jgi:hypothetical protein